MIRLLIATVLLGVTIFFVMTHHHSKAPVSLLQPIATAGAWHFDSLGATQSKMIIDGNTAQFDTTQVDGTDYNIEFYSQTCKLEEGQTYLLRFAAKASTNIAIPMSVTMSQKPFSSLGLTEIVQVNPVWVEHEYKFKAASVDGNTDRVPIFFLGTSVGTVWIKDVELKEVD